MRFSSGILWICLTLLTTSSAIAIEPPSNEKIIAAIKKSSDFGADTKVVAAVSGTEATVSTYRHRGSKDIDNDCKIEATLIAKELMVTNDFGLRRVIVHFHEPDLSGKFREVIVSYAEIKAFATGTVKEDDFMSSITLNLIPEPVKAVPVQDKVDSNSSDPATTATASSKATAPKQAESKGPNDTGKAATHEPAKEAPKKLSYISRRTGITFDFPADWTIQDRFPANGDLIFKLLAPSTKESNLEFGFRRTPRTPLECALAQKQKFAYDGVQVEECRRIKFGKGAYDGALIILTYPHSSGERYYENHLYFGKPGAIYDLWCWCDTKYYRTVSVPFWDLMNTMSFPQPAGAKSAKGKTGAKPVAKKTK